MATKGEVMKKNWKQGFTLIELLVVIAIIAVLASLLVPAVQSALQSAYRADDTSNIRSATQAMMNYSFDHDDEIVAWDWGARFQGYIYQVIPYLGGPESPQWQEAITTLRKYRSKVVLDRDILYVSGSPGWSLPSYTTASTRVDPRNPNYMKLMEIKNANRQIYAALGFGVFDETAGQDSSFTLPATRPAGLKDLHIYFPYEGQTPAGFFDGHVEMVSPKIPLDMLTNGGRRTR
jgi:prepilin-type N-terminal cleavage/methylation domain-containing protein